MDLPAGDGANQSRASRSAKITQPTEGSKRIEPSKSFPQRALNSIRSARRVSQNSWYRRSQSRKTGRRFRVRHPSSEREFGRLGYSAVPLMVNAVKRRSARYRDAFGTMVMCRHCRRTLRLCAGGNRWELVRRHVIKPPRNVSDCVCGECLENEYSKK